MLGLCFSFVVHKLKKVEQRQPRNRKKSAKKSRNETTCKQRFDVENNRYEGRTNFLKDTNFHKSGYSVLTKGHVLDKCLYFITLKFVTSR